MVEIVVVGNVNRTSGVKNFESKAGSLVRGLPFSQVQSANANGSAFVGFALRRWLVRASLSRYCGGGRGTQEFLRFCRKLLS